MPITFGANNTFDDTNFPTIRTVARHWDQTLDPNTDAAIGTTGDGISQHGNWFCQDGTGDQILGAANNSAGGGGKGFRHWVGNGTNWGGGGLEISWTTVSEFWLRYYIRFQSGFRWAGTSPSNAIDMKTIYCLPSQLGPFYFGLKDGYLGGHVQNDGISRTSPATPIWGAGNFYTDAVTWPIWQGSSLGDGLFHCIELHVKGNTGGAQNGTLEWKLDGVLRGSFTNVRYGSGSPTFSMIAIGENHNDPQSGSSANQYVDFDDIAVSITGWVGEIGGDVTAPVLSSADDGTPTGDGCTGASVSTANDANGTLYWAVVTNGGSCTDIQLKTGSGGNIVAAGNQPVIATGTQVIATITGLSVSTTYQIKFLHRDLAGNDSTPQASVNLITTTPGDTTPPVLSSPSIGTATSQGCTGASVSTVNDANGTLYWAVVTDGGSCTAAQLKAGSGGNIVSGQAGTQPVNATGTQILIVDITGLISSTGYELKFLHRDLAGNDSAQVSVHLATTAPSTQIIFFTEGFEDSNAGLLSRGWFDGTEGEIDNSVFSPNGGAGSLKFHWQLGNTNADPQTGARRHSIVTDGTETLYVQFDVKFGTAGTPWQGSGDVFVHPHIFYILSNFDNPLGGLAGNNLDFYIEAGDVSGGNARPRILIQDSGRIDTGNLNVDLLGTSDPHAVAGYNGHQDQATPSLIDTFGGTDNYTFWDAPTRSLLNNTWHTVGVYAEMNSISGGLPQADGILRVWVDEVVQFERTNIYYRTSQFDQQGFETVVISPYIGVGSPIAQDMRIDNLVVANQRETGEGVAITTPASMRSRR